MSDEDLKDAISKIGKHEGVTSVSLDRQDPQLRVEVSAIAISENAPKIYAELEKLGTVTTPEAKHDEGPRPCGRGPSRCYRARRSAPVDQYWTFTSGDWPAVLKSSLYVGRRSRPSCPGG